MVEGVNTLQVEDGHLFLGNTRDGELVNYQVPPEEVAALYLVEEPWYGLPLGLLSHFSSFCTQDLTSPLPGTTYSVSPGLKAALLGQSSPFRVVRATSFPATS